MYTLWPWLDTVTDHSLHMHTHAESNHSMVLSFYVIHGVSLQITIKSVRPTILNTMNAPVS